MITRFDCTQRNAAGLMAAGRAVPSTGLRSDARHPVDRHWLGGRMQATQVLQQVTKQVRDVESRHNPGAGPSAGAHAR